MDWVFYLGLILLILGALAFLGFKILPVKKNWNILFVIVGLLIVTGLGATLWGGLTGLAVSNPIGSSSGSHQFSYSVLATKGDATDILDSVNKVILVPETYNATAVSISTANARANFTIAITDSYADMRGVQVSCTTPVFYNQNVSVSDSTQYLIASKDSTGQADIRISGTDFAYSARSRSFLVGGEATAGQSVTVVITAPVDATAVGKLNQYNSQDITCNVAGETWALRVQKSSIIT